MVKPTLVIFVKEVFISLYLCLIFNCTFFVTSTGHRSSKCNHYDRELKLVQAKGRPSTQCDHCKVQRCYGQRPKCDVRKIAYNFNSKAFNYLFDQCGKEFNFNISLDKDICLCVGGDDCICSGSKSTKSTGEILKQANYVLMKDELLLDVLKYLQY